MSPEVLAQLQRTIAGGVRLVPPVLVRLGRRVMTADRWVALDGWTWAKDRDLTP